MEVKISYHFRPLQTFNFSQNKTLKEIILEYFNTNEMDFKTIRIIISGAPICTLDLEKPIKDFKDFITNSLTVLIHKNVIPEGVKVYSNRIVSVIFRFQSRNNSFNFSLQDNMREICDHFATQIGKYINSLEFKYKKNKVDFTKTLNEIANNTDINNGKVIILVREKFNINRNNNNSYNHNYNSSSNNIITSQNSNESFCEKNKVTLIIISIISCVSLIVFIVVLCTVILKKKDKNNENNNNKITNENCTEEYYLYKGICITYAFYATYKVDNDNEGIQIYNPDKINNQ